jgi:hypothetical protein
MQERRESRGGKVIPFIYQRLFAVYTLISYYLSGFSFLSLLGHGRSRWFGALFTNSYLFRVSVTLHAPLDGTTRMEGFKTQNTA